MTMNWINTKDRLPGDPTEVLALNGREVLVASRSEYNGIWYDINAEEVSGVTHWMPLPEPPDEPSPMTDERRAELKVMAACNSADEPPMAVLVGELAAEILAALHRGDNLRDTLKSVSVELRTHSNCAQCGKPLPRE